MKLRPIVKIHGGKFYQINFILSNFPKNYEKLAYIEPFGGGASILLNKTPSEVEVYNDLDQDLAFAVYCLKAHSDYMLKEINTISYDEEAFQWAIKTEFPADSPAIAVAEIVARRMSRGGLKSHFAWSERQRGGKPGDVNSWDTFRTILPTICERLQKVVVKWCPAIDIIKEWCADNSLLYLDPPYLPKTRSSPGVYKHEMTEKQHCELAEVVNQTPGKIAISSYPSSLYTKLYKGWNRVIKEMPNHASQQKEKERRIEVLWMNY